MFYKKYSTIISDNTILQKIHNKQAEKIIKNSEDFKIKNKKAVLKNTIAHTKYPDCIKPHVNFRIFQLLSEDEIAQNPNLPHKNDKYFITIEGKNYYLYAVKFNVYEEMQCIYYDIQRDHNRDNIEKKYMIVNERPEAMIIKYNKEKSTYKVPMCQAITWTMQEIPLNESENNL